MTSDYDIVVIGGSAAGISAAITARRYYQNKSILLIRREEKVPIPCGIPYIFGTLMEVEKNLIPDAMLENNRIDLLIDEVQEVARENKSLQTKDGKTISFAKLILATGSSPIKPPIQGIDKENVFPVYKDVSYLQNMLERINQSRNLIIIGGGFIGVEFAEECKKDRDINITLVEMMPKCLMAAFDDLLCEQAQDLLIKQGISLKLNSKVQACLGSKSVDSIELDTGEIIKADTVILGIGTTPNVRLAKTRGLAIGRLGGIKVDSYLRTSADDIFACGDCIDSKSFFTDSPCNIKLASTATTQARIAGANLYSTKRSDSGIIGVFSTALSGHAFACAGYTERDAIKEDIQIVVGHAEGPNRHPGGMPGMKNMKVKLVFNKYDQTIIGGQIFGAYNAGEMINAISAFILSKFTANDIAKFQLGTHPALTASPIAYQLVNAAELANMQM